MSTFFSGLLSDAAPFLESGARIEDVLFTWTIKEHYRFF